MCVPGMVLTIVTSVVMQLPGGRVGTQLWASSVVVVGGTVVRENVDVMSRLCVTISLVCVNVGEDVHD
jgi:hypothetical protein